VVDPREWGLPLGSAHGRGHFAVILDGFPHSGLLRERRVDQLKPLVEMAVVLGRYRKSNLTVARFEKLGAFLQQPHWEATDNGAERGARAFRHRQAPHFNLRSQAAINAALVVEHSLSKAAATDAERPEASHSTRGRKPKRTSGHEEDQAGPGKRQLRSLRTRGILSPAR
jgi:hypothetical protein